MKKILLFDTAEGSDNAGDNIIMDYCQQQLTNLLSNDIYWYDKVPTHLEIGKTVYSMNKNASYNFVCGTNILKTTIIRKKLWKIGFKEAINLKDLILMGIGWGNYNKFGTDPYTKWVYKSILSSKFTHSVRDGYTEQKLREIGITNVLNTACPTMWKLTPEFCNTIPSTKSNEVVTALTYYKPDVERDKEMFHILAKNYSKIYLWLQQARDYEYYQSLNLDLDITIIKPLISEYDKLLMNHNIDFIGSRLHGGIRALNFKKRALIIGIDNRATEINKDTNLPFISREKIEHLNHWINSASKTEIYLPNENINKWKSQFLNHENN